MHDLLIQKLLDFTHLLSEDIDLIKVACTVKPKLVPARTTILRQGDMLNAVPFILSGWICASKHLKDGRWQVLSFFVKGDLCDCGLPTLREMDHSLRTLSDSLILELPNEALDEMITKSPRLRAAFTRSSLVQSVIAREWVLSLGQLNAKERCAHLICELFWRLRAANAIKGNSFEFPLTQEEVGATIGISTVHTNRILQSLRDENLIEQKGRRLTIKDQFGLEELAMFNPSFLHLNPLVMPPPTLARPVAHIG